jgi:hypothetical protein
VRISEFSDIIPFEGLMVRRMISHVAEFKHSQK